MAQVSLPSRKRARLTESEFRCAACTRLFSSQGAQELQSDDGFIHRTRQGAEASAQEGCSLCDFLVRAGKEKFGKDRFDKYRWRAGTSIVFRSQSQSENQDALLTMLRGRVEGYDEVLTVYPFAKRGLKSFRDSYNTPSILISTRGPSRSTHPATSSASRCSEQYCFCRRPEAHP